MFRSGPTGCGVVDDNKAVKI